MNPLAAPTPHGRVPLVTPVQIALRLLFAVLLLLAFDWGVLSFFRTVDAADEGMTGTADAIVVFSGDPTRIARGFDLLAAGKAPLLFTAGVDNGAQIEALKQAHSTLSACCVYGETTTASTHADAAAISAWAKAHGARSLIVVTTNIHMPRAAAELRRCFGGTDLRFSGVSQGLYDSRDWSRDPAVLPRLREEWGKYVVVRARQMFGQQLCGIG